MNINDQRLRGLPAFAYSAIVVLADFTRGPIWGASLHGFLPCMMEARARLAEMAGVLFDAVPHAATTAMAVEAAARTATTNNARRTLEGALLNLPPLAGEAVYWWWARGPKN
jgi:hypothetical protein